MKEGNNLGKFFSNCVLVLIMFVITKVSKSKICFNIKETDKKIYNLYLSYYRITGLIAHKCKILEKI